MSANGERRDVSKWQFLVVTGHCAGHATCPYQCRIFSDLSCRMTTSSRPIARRVRRIVADRHDPTVAFLSRRNAPPVAAMARRHALAGASLSPVRRVAACFRHFCLSSDGVNFAASGQCDPTVTSSLRAIADQQAEGEGREQGKADLPIRVFIPRRLLPPTPTVRQA